MPWIDPINGRLTRDRELKLDELVYEERGPDAVASRATVN